MSANPQPFLALLRGINVGGNNLISKDELKESFESLGLRSVRTYIQSGNILFRSNETSSRVLTEIIERSLSKKLNGEISAVVIPRTRFRKMVAAAPSDWGNTDGFKHHALFLIHQKSAKRFLSNIPQPRPQIEKVSSFSGVIFWSVKQSQATRSSLMKLPGCPEYQWVTVRNQNTVFKLNEMLDGL